ncbi:GNAT family N-acetyltransferase [Cytobacillus kochii]|uniref:GNAT family N-acetyltransferase n=1 Tax=Cytobacillus kochii TaxID=859143 RepID=UPI0012FE1449|nr:GNAT family protein [Cytobacillus kochii]
MSEEVQGQGIVAKSVQSVIDYLFEVMDLHRIESQCAINNVQSLSISKRLGFYQEGIKKDGQWYMVNYEDLVTYSLLKENWKN